MKRKILSGVLAVLMVFGSAALPQGYSDQGVFSVSALNEDGKESVFIRRGDWEVKELLDDNDEHYLLISGYFGEGGEISLPEEIDGKPVKGIMENAFAARIYGEDGTAFTYAENDDVRSVGVPSSVTVIDPQAFALCPSLGKVEISEDSESLCEKDGAVYNKDMTELLSLWDKSRSSVRIPDSVKTVGDSAFEDCKNLVSVYIPDSVTEIGNSAFKNCSSLKDLVIGGGVKKLDRSMFQGCKEIENLSLSEGIEEIGSCTFADMRNLLYAEIPESATAVGERAFGFVIEYGDSKYDYDYLYTDGFVLGVYKDSVGEDYAEISELDYKIISDDSKTDIGKCTVSLSEDSFVYSGEEICPQVKVTDGEKTLEEYKDYVSVYTDNTAAGTGYVNIKGIGRYSGDVSKTFDISRKEITDAELEQTSFIYDGTEKTPEVIVKDGKRVLVKDKDFIAVYANNEKIGTAMVTIVGKGNYTGVVTKLFEIKALPLPEPQLAQTEFTYSGKEIKPEIIITNGEKVLSEGTDYIVEYADNVNAGTAKAVIVGKGSYSGTFVKQFTVKTKAVPKPKLGETSYTYDGTAKKPSVTVKDGDSLLTEGRDYTVAYSANVNAGTATVTVTGKGNYGETAKQTFTISRRPISNVALSTSKYIYDGKVKTPVVTVTDGNKTLMEGAAYTVSYSNNKKVGTASVKITGKGNYTGTVTKTFVINPAKQTVQKLETRYKGFYVDWAQKGSATGYEIQYGTSSSFKGASKFRLEKNKPDTCTIGGLAAGKKYYVRVRSYTVSAGKTYYGEWSDGKSVTTAKYNIASAKVSGISAKAFTGKAVTQGIVVKYNGKTLKNGTDYTVKYSNNKNVGTATVIITGKGSYGGIITKTFNINPAKQTIQKLTAKSKAFYIDWAQKGSATGYEIQYSASSKFTSPRTVTITNNKTDKVTVSKLSGNKKYYVRVRSYTVVKGKKYYGAWSDSKSVTTKK